MLFCLDLLWSVLRGCEPVQAPTHLHREDHRYLQGQEEARGPSPRIRHHRYRLQVLCITFVLVLNSAAALKPAKRCMSVIYLQTCAREESLDCKL